MQSPFEAAALLEQAVRDGGESVTFRTEEIDLDAVYSALEARYLYAFALHATTRPNQTIELRVEVLPRTAGAGLVVRKGAGGGNGGQRHV